MKNNIYKAINYYFDQGFYAFPINLFIDNINNKKQFESSVKWDKSRITKYRSIKLLEAGNYNSIALKTGQESNLFILDVDKDDNHSGIYSLEVLRISIPPDTPCTITPSKGIHFYFRFPNELKKFSTGSNNSLLLDWRGEGGIVFVPPSHPTNGDPYKWKISLEDGVMRKPPDSLIQWILSHKSSDIAESEFKQNKALSDVSERQLNWFLRTKSECEKMPVGDRSEKDFDLLCVGIKIGLGKEKLYN